MNRIDLTFARATFTLYTTYVAAKKENLNSFFLKLLMKHIHERTYT